jgi:NAD(P)-dependent dehydrogenase (short-subunit alcohol dehydrogenase family)
MDNRINRLFDLTNRTALVTGGGRGIGRSISEVLAAAGASLILVSRNKDNLDRAKDELVAQYGGRVEACPADLSDRKAVASAAERAIDLVGRIDVLVHCAGISSIGMVENIEDEDWDKVQETNVMSGVSLTRAFVPAMKKNGWGRIIFFSSVAAYRTLAGGFASYSASKAALHGFTRAVAVELGPFGITVNCILPGAFLTDMTKSSSRELMTRLAAVKRVGETREMEGPILLLASDAGSFITGSVLHVDGGFGVNFS